MDLVQLVKFTSWMAIILTGISMSVFVKYIYDQMAKSSQQAIIITGIGNQAKTLEELTEDELKELLNRIQSAGDADEKTKVDHQSNLESISTAPSPDERMNITA